MRKIGILSVSLATLLLACPPPQYGLVRVGYIDRAPETSCVQRALEADSSIQGLRLEDFGGGRRITWRGLAPPDSAPTFIYAQDGRDRWLQFHIDQDRPVRVYHAVSTTKAAPVSVLLALRSQLTTVEVAVADRCGIRELVAVLEETCRGDHCDELEAHAAQQAVAADAQQLVPIDRWYRSGGGRRAPVLVISAVERS